MLERAGDAFERDAGGGAARGELLRLGQATRLKAFDFECPEQQVPGKLRLGVHHVRDGGAKRVDDLG